MGYTINDFRVGDRVQLHPATDLWMSGDPLAIGLSSIGTDARGGGATIRVSNGKYGKPSYCGELEFTGKALS